MTWYLVLLKYYGHKENHDTTDQLIDYKESHKLECNYLKVYINEIEKSTYMHISFRLLSENFYTCKSADSTMEMVPKRFRVLRSMFNIEEGQF